MSATSVLMRGCGGLPGLPEGEPRSAEGEPLEPTRAWCPFTLYDVWHQGRVTFTTEHHGNALGHIRWHGGSYVVRTVLVSNVGKPPQDCNMRVPVVRNPLGGGKVAVLCRVTEVAPTMATLYGPPVYEVQRQGFTGWTLCGGKCAALLRAAQIERNGGIAHVRCRIGVATERVEHRAKRA